jgi:hypothetical protein
MKYGLMQIMLGKMKKVWSVKAVGHCVIRVVNRPPFETLCISTAYLLNI